MAHLQQYEELLDAVKTRCSDADKQEIESMYQRVSVLRIVVGICILIALALAFVKQNMFSCIALAAAVVAFLLFSSQQKKMQAGFRSVMLDKCDPNTAVDRFVVFANHSSLRSWSQNYYNVGNALFYAGRFSEARSVAYVIKNHKENFTDAFYAEMLGSQLCAQAGDIDGLERHIAQIRTLSKDIKSSSPELRFLYSEALQLPRYAYLEMDHAYQTMYNELLEDDKGATMLRRVEKAYRLVGLAAKLGMREKEQEYRQFVLENGGTTFFKRELGGQTQLSLDLDVDDRVSERDAAAAAGEAEAIAVAEVDAVAEAAESPVLTAAQAETVPAEGAAE